MAFATPREATNGSLAQGAAHNNPGRLQTAGPAPDPPHGFLPEPMLCKKQKNATDHRNKTEALQPLEVCCSPPNYLVANLSISFLNMRGTSDLCVDLHTFALSIRACPSNSSRHDKHDMTAEVFMPRL